MDMLVKGTSFVLDILLLSRGRSLTFFQTSISFSIVCAMASHSAEYLSQTKGPKIIGVFWVMAGLTLVMVVSRLYIRAGVLRNMGSDDWLIAASMVSSIHKIVSVVRNNANQLFKRL